MKAVILALCICSAAAAATPRRLYEIAFEEMPSGKGLEVRVVNVTFFITPPKGEIVDRIVRESLEHAALVNPSVDIVGFAFDKNEDALGDDDQWTGPFVWDSKVEKVVRLSERKK